MKRTLILLVALCSALGVSNKAYSERELQAFPVSVTGQNEQLTVDHKEGLQATEKDNQVSPPKQSLSNDDAFLRCGQMKPKATLQPIFKDLQQVILLIEVYPISYFSVPECYGREEKCADKEAVLRHYPERRKKYIQDLKRQTREYPKALYPDNLIVLYGDIIRKRLLPLVMPDAECKRPDLQIATWPKVNTDFVAKMANQDVLTIRISINVGIDTQPHIAVVNTFLSRPTVGGSIPPVGGTLAVPLNMSNEKINKMLVKFADRFMQLL